MLIRLGPSPFLVSPERLGMADDVEAVLRWRFTCADAGESEWTTDVDAAADEEASAGCRDTVRDRATVAEAECGMPGVFIVRAGAEAALVIDCFDSDELRESEPSFIFARASSVNLCGFALAGLGVPSPFASAFPFPLPVGVGVSPRFGLLAELERPSLKVVVLTPAESLS